MFVTVIIVEYSFFHLPFFIPICPAPPPTPALLDAKGVQFLYDCVTGTKIEGHNGCIMADEMVCRYCTCKLFLQTF